METDVALWWGLLVPTNTDICDARFSMQMAKQPEDGEFSFLVIPK